MHFSWIKGLISKIKLICAFLEIKGLIFAIVEIEGFSALSNRPPLEPRSDCSAVAVANSAKPFNFQMQKINPEIKPLIQLKCIVKIVK